MLVLTRRIGESVRIGNDIDVVVLSIRGSQVQIGFKAPKDLKLVRHELSDRASNRGNTVRPSP